MTSAIRSAAGPTVDDLNYLLADVYRRYRQGEVGEQTAYRETVMIKAMIDGKAKTAKVDGIGGAPRFERIERVIVHPKAAKVDVELDMTKLTDDELDILACARQIIEKAKKGGAS
jgi:hypothetical protein